MENTKTSLGWKMIAPVMLAFFTMGFVDLVGTSANYVQADFNLSDSQSNLFTTMVFLWFLIFSVPTGVLMNRLGRRQTVLISIVVTAVSLVFPILAYTQPNSVLRLWLMIGSFALLGIGNTVMQVSLNPLLSTLVSNDALASSLTLGQFVKAIASFIGPLLASWFAVHLGAWWAVYAIYLAVAGVAYVLLRHDHIEESAQDSGKATITSCFALLRDSVVLLCFLGIVCHVGIDVGINATAPKILMAKTGETLSTAGTATSVYFLFRTLGALVGGFALRKLSRKTSLRICAALMVVSAVCFGVFLLLDSPAVFLFYVAVALIGFGNANVFSLFLTTALLHLPLKKNEISGLMMMGLMGGAIFPPIMGFVADISGSQLGAIIVMTVGVLYVAATAVTPVLFRTVSSAR